MAVRMGAIVPVDEEEPPMLTSRFPQEPLGVPTGPKALEQPSWSFDLVSRVLFPAPEASYGIDSFPEELIFVPKSLDPRAAPPQECIPCLFLVSPSARFLVLYLHSNAEDLGRCHQFCTLLRYQFQVHVLAVEYPGYGICPGRADEESVTENALVAYRFIREILHWPLDGILILGRSVGTGPALAIAAENEVYGVVLVSPFMSIQEIVRDMVGPLGYLITDRFPNKDRIKCVKSPLLIVHGKKDMVVPVSHGKRLFELCPCRKRLVIPDAMEHNTNLHSDASYFVLPMLQFYALPDYCFEEIRVPTWVFDKRLSTHYKGERPGAVISYTGTTQADGKADAERTGHSRSSTHSTDSAFNEKQAATKAGSVSPSARPAPSVAPPIRSPQEDLRRRRAASEAVALEAAPPIRSPQEDLRRRRAASEAAALEDGASPRTTAVSSAPQSPNVESKAETAATEAAANEAIAAAEFLAVPPAHQLETKAHGELESEFLLLAAEGTIAEESYPIDDIDGEVPPLLPKASPRRFVDDALREAQQAAGGHGQLMPVVRARKECSIDDFVDSSEEEVEELVAMGPRGRMPWPGLVVQARHASPSSINSEEEMPEPATEGFFSAVPNSRLIGPALSQGPNMDGTEQPLIPGLRWAGVQQSMSV